MFCEEDDRYQLPSDDGDVLAYVSYLYLEKRIEAMSLTQYMTTLSKSHELYRFISLTKKSMVRAVVQAYARRHDAHGDKVVVRVGCSAEFMRHVVELGMDSVDV